jgi:hypothetical protein
MICWHTSGGSMSALGEVQQQQQHYELTPKWVVAQVMHVVDNIPSSDLLPIKLNISAVCCCANARSFLRSRSIRTWTAAAAGLSFVQATQLYKQ